MAQISYTFPTSQAEIPAAIESVNAQIQAAKAQLDVICSVKRAIQNMCKHPNKSHSRDYDGGSSSYCPTCERSW